MCRGLGLPNPTSWIKEDINSLFQTDSKAHGNPSQRC